MDHSNITNHLKSFIVNLALTSFMRIALPLINSRPRSTDLFYIQTAFLSDLGNQDIHPLGKNTLDVVGEGKGRGLPLKF
jgi:hypothetical protein